MKTPHQPIVSTRKPKQSTQRALLAILALLLSSPLLTAPAQAVEEGVPIRQFGFGNVSSVAFSPDGSQILVGGDNATLLDAQTGKVLTQFFGHTNTVTSVAFSPNGSQVLTGSDDSTAKLWDATTGEEIRTFRMGHRYERVTSVVFSPDGSQVLTASYYTIQPDDIYLPNNVSVSTVKLWNATTGEEIRTFGEKRFNNRVTSVAFSPDGSQVLTGSYGIANPGHYTVSKAKLWNTETGEEIRTLWKEYMNEITSLAFSPDGSQVLTGSNYLLYNEPGFPSDYPYNGAAKLYNAETGEEIRIFAHLADGVSSLAFSSDGSQVLTGSYDNTAKLWNTVTAEEITTFTGHSSAITSVAFSPDDSQVLIGSLDKTVKLWNPATGEEIRNFSGHTDSVNSVAFSSEGSQMLTGSDDETAKLWNTATGEVIRTFTGSSGYKVTSVAFSPDDSQVLVGSGFRWFWSSETEAEAKLYDVATGEEKRTFSELSYGGNSVAFSLDGSQVLTASNDHTAKLWNAATGEEIRTFAGPSSKTITSVAFSPDGSQILTGSSGLAILWDTASGAEIRDFPGYGGCVFSPDGSQVLTGSYGMAILWDTTTGEKIRTFMGHSSSFASVVFSPDGSLILNRSEDEAKLWNLATGREIKTFKEHTDSVTSAAFSPDGSQILTGSADGTAILWELGEIPPYSPRNDLNGDGRSDLILKQKSTNEVSLCPMNADASSWTVSYSSTNFGEKYDLLAISDMNNDGFYDLNLKYNRSETVYLCNLNPPGADTIWDVNYYSQSWYKNYVTEGTGDFNGDGYDDLLLRYRPSNTLYVCLTNSPGGGKLWEVSSYFDHLFDDYDLIGVGDLNGDGRGDMVLRQIKTGIVYICAFQESGAAYDIGEIKEWGESKRLIGMGDLNGNGREDLIVRDINTGMVSFQHAQAVTTTWPISYSLTTSYSENWGSDYKLLATGDFNADGRDDIIRQSSAGIASICLMNASATSWTVSYEADWSDYELLNPWAATNNPDAENFAGAIEPGTP